MELIRISDNALKVMLSRADMERYEIEYDMLDYENIETRRVISGILAEAKRRVGFSAESDRLYIQAFSDGEGGCELFVRRGGESERCVYEFLGMSPLLLACGRLLRCGYRGHSIAYCYGGGERYYLELCDSGGYIFLSELGRRVVKVRGFFTEHTERLCDNAVEVLGRLR